MHLFISLAITAIAAHPYSDPAIASIDEELFIDNDSYFEAGHIQYPDVKIVIS
jgi:hypothetical protein